MSERTFPWKGHPLNSEDMGGCDADEAATGSDWQATRSRPIRGTIGLDRKTSNCIRTLPAAMAGAWSHRDDRVREYLRGDPLAHDK
jgi:hypothetical protein